MNDRRKGLVVAAIFSLAAWAVVIYFAWSVTWR